MLTWQPPPDDQLNGLLTGYIVNVTETETGNQYQISTVSAQYTFEGLHPFYQYSFIVAASTIGQGPFSDIFTLQMPEDGTTYYTANVLDIYTTLCCVFLNLQPLRLHLQTLK